MYIYTEIYEAAVVHIQGHIDRQGIILESYRLFIKVPLFIHVFFTTAVASTMRDEMKRKQ